VCFPVQIVTLPSPLWQRHSTRINMADRVSGTTTDPASNKPRFSRAIASGIRAGAGFEHSRNTRAAVAGSDDAEVGGCEGVEMGRGGCYSHGQSIVVEKPVSQSCYLVLYLLLPESCRCARLLPWGCTVLVSSKSVTLCWCYLVLPQPTECLGSAVQT
jgi:hypothetical protein